MSFAWWIQPEVRVRAGRGAGPGRGRRRPGTRFRRSRCPPVTCELGPRAVMPKTVAPVIRLLSTLTGPELRTSDPDAGADQGVAGDHRARRGRARPTAPTRGSQRMSLPVTTVSLAPVRIAIPVMPAQTSSLAARCRCRPRAGCRSGRCRSRRCSRVGSRIRGDRAARRRRAGHQRPAVDQEAVARVVLGQVAAQDRARRWHDRRGTRCRRCGPPSWRSPRCRPCSGGCAARQARWTRTGRRGTSRAAARHEGPVGVVGEGRGRRTAGARPAGGAGPGHSAGAAAPEAERRRPDVGRGSSGRRLSRMYGRPPPRQRPGIWSSGPSP